MKSSPTHHGVLLCASSCARWASSLDRVRVGFGKTRVSFMRELIFSRSPLLSRLSLFSTRRRVSLRSEQGLDWNATSRPPCARLFALFPSKNARQARRVMHSQERELKSDALGHSRGAWLSDSPPPSYTRKNKTFSPLPPLDRIRVRAERGVGRGRGCSDGEDAPRSGGRGRRRNRGQQERRRRRLRAIPRGAQPALRRARGPRQGAGASGSGRSRAEHGRMGRAGGERARGGEGREVSRERKGDGK